MMKRWTLTDLIEAKIFGFEKGEDKIERFKPFEEVESESFRLDNVDIITLRSASYEETFKKDYLTPIRQAFKDAPMFLARTKAQPTKHLLIFELGQEYYALLAPFIKESED